MKLYFLVLLCLCPVLLHAQQNTNDNKPAYPQDYFRNPLDIPIFLAGNFGECRPGHFHSGVDIKTLGAENQPVHAAANGYISRIKMESGGFGHGIYITHPNGYTTLYAHLNKFAPAIQKYVSGQQYEKKRWDVDLQFSPDKFPVKKDDLIAWSGNTGASTAPHLHFEIRDTKTEHPLNPELFGLKLIDKIAPVPAEVVFYFDNKTEGVTSFYESERVTLALEKKGDYYKPTKSDAPASYKIKADTVYIRHGNTGIGINVDDYMDGSDNTISFYTTKLYLDDSLQAQVTLDNIGYDESRYINAYTDYKARQQLHKWVQCLFQLPGNHLDRIYSNLNSNKGFFNLRDTFPHKINIIITDDRENQTRITFYAACRNIFQPPVTIKENHPSTPFFANRLNVFNDPNISFILDNRQLYDDILFNFRSQPDSLSYSDKYSLDESYVPLHHYFDLLIKPNKSIPTLLAGKVVLMYSDNKDTDGRAAVVAENGMYKAKVRNFGTYWLNIDTTGPAIKSFQKNGANLSKASQILFEVKDSITSVKSFSGWLDGKWISFEQHSRKFFYNFDSHCVKGKHELVFKAADENGNESVYKLNFTR